MKQILYNYVDMLNGQKSLIDNQIDLQAIINEEIKDEEALSIQVPPFDLSKYDQLQKNGEGSFGFVYEVKDKKSGELFSAKISKLECYNSLKDQDNVVNFIREVTILYKMKHPSIMKFIGYCQLNFKRSMKSVVVTELIRNGSLDKLIEQK